MMMVLWYRWTVYIADDMDAQSNGELNGRTGCNICLTDCVAQPKFGYVSIFLNSAKLSCAFVCFCSFQLSLFTCPFHLLGVRT